MNYRYLLHIVLFCMLSLNGKAQKEYELMNWKTQYTVRTYLLQQMHAQYDVRREEMQKALQSRDSMLSYRNKCRQQYRNLLGSFPEKTPLHPQITKTLQRDGYRIENVLFESQPHHHVTANFYIPDGKGPFPATLFFCGHEMTSKATVSYQKTAILFAKKGFVVLVIDPISQGERFQFTDKNGQRILRGSTTEHTLLNAGANLVGTNVVTYELYDNLRSLDYLFSRSEVDTTRVGVLGNSGGGAQTVYFVGYDNRVKVAAPCSNPARRELNYMLDGTGDGCQQMPYEGKDHLEIGDFLIMFAPKPVEILAGRYDFVNYIGTKETADELHKVYSILGEPDKVKLVTVDDGHGISKPKREAAVQWFRRWLCNDSSAIIEPNLSVLTEKELNCTTTGQVNRTFPDELDVQQINKERANAFAENRRKFAAENDLNGYQQKIEQLLAINPGIKQVNADEAGEEIHPDYQLKEYILRTPNEIPLPCLVYQPTKKTETAKVHLFVYEEGKAELADNDSLIEANMRAGNMLVLADLRGFGETQENKSANEWKYYNREYHNAIISLHIGKPIVGQRVTDMFTLLDFISTKVKNPTVTVYASGAVGPVAEYAALYRKQIKTIHILHSIQSYEEILDYPMEKDWYSYVVPDVLQYFDLPDLQSLRNDLQITFQGAKGSTEKSNQI